METRSTKKDTPPLERTNMTIKLVDAHTTAHEQYTAIKVVASMEGHKKDHIATTIERNHNINRATARYALTDATVAGYLKQQITYSQGFPTRRMYLTTKTKQILAEKDTSDDNR